MGPSGAGGDPRVICKTERGKRYAASVVDLYSNHAGPHGSLGNHGVLIVSRVRVKPYTQDSGASLSASRTRGFPPLGPGLCNVMPRTWLFVLATHHR